MKVCVSYEKVREQQAYASNTPRTESYMWTYIAICSFTIKESCVELNTVVLWKEEEKEIMRKTDTEKSRPSKGEQQEGNNTKLYTILLIIIIIFLS